jgi:hypothetical protein
MNDPILKKVFGGDTDNKRARKFAEKIAALVNSSVLPNNKVILGEGYYPFKIAFHTKALRLLRIDGLGIGSRITCQTHE